MAAWGLGFREERLEAGWERRFAADAAALDACVSLQTLLFPGLVARTLWGHFRAADGVGSTLGAADVLWLALFLAWAPLILLLTQRRPAAFLRLRTPLVLLARLQRLLTIMRFAPLFNDEAGGQGALLLPGAAPASSLGMLIWRPGSISTLLCTYMLPLKYNLPSAAVVLLAMLHSTLRQCTAECRGSQQPAAALRYADVARQLRSRLPWWPGSGGGVAACSSRDALAGSCGADACRLSCVAVHGWLQLVLGTLLPVLVTWAVEEASRYRFQRRWLEVHGEGEEGGQAAAASLARPLSAAALAAWLAVCAWVLWLLMDAVVL